MGTPEFRSIKYLPRWEVKAFRGRPTANRVDQITCGPSPERFNRARRPPDPPPEGRAAEISEIRVFRVQRYRAGEDNPKTKVGETVAREVVVAAGAADAVIAAVKRAAPQHATLAALQLIADFFRIHFIVT